MIGPLIGKEEANVLTKYVESEEGAGNPNFLKEIEVQRAHQLQSLREDYGKLRAENERNHKNAIQYLSDLEKMRLNYKEAVREREQLRADLNLFLNNGEVEQRLAKIAIAIKKVVCAVTYEGAKAHARDALKLLEIK
jgi:hypothetical protein